MNDITKQKTVYKKMPLTGEGVASVALNASYLFAGRWLTIGVRFIYAIILTRYIGPELYGYLNYGISWYFAFFPLAALSLGALLSKEVGFDRKKGGRVVNQIFTLKLFTSLLASVLCGLIGLVIEEKATLRIILLVFSFSLMGRSLWVFAQSVFTAYEVSGYSLREYAIFRPLEVVFGLIVLACGGGVIGVACVHGISWWLQAMRGFILIHQRITPMRLDWTWRVLFRFFMIGLPLTLGNIFSSWVINGPLVMYRYIVQNDNHLGQLALAMQVIILLGNLTTIAFSASLPLISRSVSREDGKDIYFVDAMVRFGIILGILAEIAALGAGKWLVQVFFGSKFGEAGYLLRYVVWLLVPTMCINVIWNVYIARAKYVLLIVSAGSGAAVFTATFAWFVKIMGTPGVIVSSGVGMIFTASILLFAVARFERLNVQRIILLPSLISTATLGIYFALDLLHVGVWISMLLCYAILFVCIIVLGVVTPTERRAMIGIVKNKLG